MKGGYRSKPWSHKGTMELCPLGIWDADNDIFIQRQSSRLGTWGCLIQNPWSRVSNARPRRDEDVTKNSAQQVWSFIDFCSSNGNLTTSSRTLPGSMLESQFSGSISDLLNESLHFKEIRGSKEVVTPSCKKQDRGWKEQLCCLRKIQLYNL